VAPVAPKTVVRTWCSLLIVLVIFFFAVRDGGSGSRTEIATAVVGGVGAYGVGTTAVALADEGFVAGVGAKDFGEVVVDVAKYTVA